MSTTNDTFLGHHLRSMTTAQVLADKASSQPDRVFLRYLPDGREITFAQLDALSNRIANGLARAGVEHGTHVAVLMDNSPEELLTFFALGKLGAVAVPINTANRGASLKYLLTHSDCAALVVDYGLWDRFSELSSDVPKLRTAIVLRGSSNDAMPDAPGLNVLDWRSFEDEPDTPPTAQVHFTDTAYIIYTSGTTGPAKGVMITQTQCFMWGLSHARAFGHRSSDVIYICLPLFHVNALQGATYNALMLGSTIVLQKRFSASGFWNDIRANDVTITNLLGSMVNILWSRPAETSDSDNRLRMCMSAPIPAFGPGFEQRFGLRFIQSYSLTDFGPSHAYTLVDPADRLGSCGRVRAGVLARVVDQDDLSLPNGERGELVLRHEVPWMHSQGYYKMPEATVKSWRNGWFHTGDRGYIDEEGYFWFLDRMKDAIRRRGENISAYEVEQSLQSHPQVKEVAVFAVRSEMSEDEVAAAVVLRDGAYVTHEELIDFCRHAMAYFMVPRFLVFMDDLPRNPSHKVEKFKLREMANDDMSLLWDRERAGIVIKR
ncbi:MAG: AMP-binding protein [Pseudomonadota bacterium]